MPGRKQLRERMFLLGLWFEGTVRHSRGGLVAGAWDDWSHHICSQEREKVNAGFWTSSPWDGAGHIQALPSSLNLEIPSQVHPEVCLLCDKLTRKVTHYKSNHSWLFAQGPPDSLAAVVIAHPSVRCSVHSRGTSRL